MTSNPCDANGHDFLVFDYPDAGFLLNRNQFVSGIFIFRERPFKSSFKYIVSGVDYKESRLAVFDLDAFLGDIGRIESEHTLKVGLICDLSTFAEHNRLLYEAFIRRQNETVSTSLLAIMVGGHARIAKYRFSKIRLFPPSLRKKQIKMGILGCEFSDHTIRFFLDVETIFSNLLVRWNETRIAGRGKKTQSTAD